jgi:hypothetical protein
VRQLVARITVAVLLSACTVLPAPTFEPSTPGTASPAATLAASPSPAIPTAVPEPDATPVLTPVPLGTRSDTKGKDWVLVGGLEADFRPGVQVDPAFDANAAAHVVLVELAAGRGRWLAGHADEPQMHPTDSAFVPALWRVIGPQGSHDFQVADPVAAWVVAVEGRGTDGPYSGIGIVGQDGRLIDLFVYTPGYG